MKKMVILTVLLLLLVAATAAIAGCGGSSSATGDTSSKSTQNGTSNGTNEAASGMPIYPGAEEVQTAGPTPPAGANGPMGSMPGNNGNSQGPGMMAPPDGSMPGPNGPQGSMPSGSGVAPPQGGRPGGMAAYWTGDSVSKVAAWYKDQLSGKTGFSQTTPQGPQGTAQGNGVMYTFKSGSVTKSVMIREDTMDSKGGTLIMIGEVPGGIQNNQPTNQLNT